MKILATTRISFEPQRLWCGSGDSYAHVLAAAAKAENLALARASAHDDEGDEDMPSLWSRQGNVAVVDIQGPLVQGSAGWMSFFGVVGYDDIRRALIEAAEDSEVGSILLNISSGGGQVAGLTDTVDFLSEIRRVKPVHTYGESSIASAAYWLGSNADTVSISNTTMAGSIGVLITHVERSKQLADDGLGVTVVRAGKYKAITNNLEPLSAEGRQQLQSQADDIYEQFVGYVSQARRVSTETADKDMGQGRVFMGRRALEAGLVDALGNFDSALNSAQQAADRRLSRTANRGGGMRFGGSVAQAVDHNKSTLTIGTATMPPTLSPEKLAALAAGATAESLGLENSTATAALGVAAAGSQEAPAQAEVKLEVAAASEDAQPAVQVEVKPEGEVVAFLRGELRSANADLATAQAEVAALRGQLEASVKLVADLTPIVRGSVTNMAVALGSSAAAHQDSDVSVLLAEHARLQASFQEKFKVGGVSAAPGSTASDTKPKAALVDPLFVTLAKSTADRNAK